MSASPIYGVQRFLHCTGGSAQGGLRELVISVPYDPSSVEYEAKPAVNGILGARVKQEGVHRYVSQAENNMPNVPKTLLHVCQKIKASPARKQKESSRIRGTEDKQDKPAKVASLTLDPSLVSKDKHDDVTDTDEDLVAQFEQEATSQ